MGKSSIGKATAAASSAALSDEVLFDSSWVKGRSLIDSARSGWPRSAPTMPARMTTSNAFNYQQTPLGPVPMTQQTIAPAELQYIAAHPPNPNGPT